MLNSPRDFSHKPQTPLHRRSDPFRREMRLPVLIAQGVPFTLVTGQIYSFRPYLQLWIDRMAVAGFPIAWQQSNPILR